MYRYVFLPAGTAATHSTTNFPSPFLTPPDDDDDDVYLYKKLPREGVTKFILYMLPYRPAKKA
jgi:hypothetical protein